MMLEDRFAEDFSGDRTAEADFGPIGFNAVRSKAELFGRTENGASFQQRWGLLLRRLTRQY